MRNDNSIGNHLLAVLKAGIFSAVLSLLCILVLTLICGWADVSDGVLIAVSRVCKGLAIAGGCILFVRGDRGWLKGMVTGVFAAMLSYLVFAPMGGSSLSWTSLLEVLFGGVAGMIGGIVAVNLRKE